MRTTKKYYQTMKKQSSTKSKPLTKPQQTIRNQQNQKHTMNTFENKQKALQQTQQNILRQ